MTLAQWHCLKVEKIFTLSKYRIVGMSREDHDASKGCTALAARCRNAMCPNAHLQEDDSWAEAREWPMTLAQWRR